MKGVTHASFTVGTNARAGKWLRSRAPERALAPGWEEVAEGLVDESLCGNPVETVEAVGDHQHLVVPTAHGRTRMSFMESTLIDNLHVGCVEFLLLGCLDGL